jgi:hypothetical protein
MLPDELDYPIDDNQQLIQLKPKTNLKSKRKKED